MTLIAEATEFPSRDDDITLEWQVPSHASASERSITAASLQIILTRTTMRSDQRASPGSSTMTLSFDRTASGSFLF